MIYVVRWRFKESLAASDLGAVNALLDREVFPALTRVPGVRGVQAYQALNGELVMLLDVEGLAAIDRALADRAYGQVASKLFTYLVRTGGEVWYDRAAFEGCYG